ncbi:hypothetical protein IWZ03DRAFT_376880, partial [Phyllosticta citriasiana]
MMPNFFLILCLSLSLSIFSLSLSPPLSAVINLTPPPFFFFHNTPVSHHYSHISFVHSINDNDAPSQNPNPIRNPILPIHPSLKGTIVKRLVASSFARLLLLLLLLLLRLLSHHHQHHHHHHHRTCIHAMLAPIPFMLASQPVSDSISDIRIRGEKWRETEREREE